MDATVIVSWEIQVSLKSNKRILIKDRRGKKKIEVKVVPEIAMMCHKQKSDGYLQKVGHSKENFTPRV